jgi:hypothetical protein
MKLKKQRTFDDLDLGDEQVTSNECWDPDVEEEVTEGVYPDLDLDEEQVTSNECYDVEDK